MRWPVTFWAVLLINTLISRSVSAQENPAAANPASPTATSPPSKDEDVGGETLPAGEDPENHLLLPLVKHMAQDQRTFWTFPARLRTQDLRWVLPSSAFVGAVIASDSWISRQAPQSPSRITQSKNFSNYAVFSLIGVTGGSYILGEVTHNDHLQETGFLAGEAAVDSTFAAYVLKEIAQRPRPYQGNGHGSFIQGGSSFPSEHAAVAWSAASVLAHEYPGTLTQVLAYGLASAVTVTRITGQQHFASDALIGSALGWYFGRQVYRAHHDTELGGSSWGSLLPERTADNPRDPANMGSAYVSLDSWVYPAFARLQALGYLHGAYLNQRPWTRRECASMLSDVAENIPGVDEPGGDDGSKLYRALAEEFSPEKELLEGGSNVSATLESAYVRYTGISGPPLRDSFHFGQTLINDYGRPYGEGSNTIFGLSGHAEAGPFFVQLRAEYQNSPATPPYSSQTVQAIEQVDTVPTFANSTASISRPVLLEGMVGFSFHNTEVSFGKETAWLGPSRSGSLLMSNNATPISMVRIDSVAPFHIPGVSRLLGPAKTEFFIGQLSGHSYVFNGNQTLGPELTVQPFIHDDRISFQPTANLEFGMGISVMFGGQDLPFTWHNFLRTYYAHSPITSLNPGKRFSGFDFTYRIPRLRNWLTFYLDSLVVDEVSPIGSTRPNLSPGLYMPQLPKLHQMEFRIEGLKTDQAPHEGFPAGYVYTDRRYLAGYSNDQLLIGNWIGRAGIGGQAWATYNFSARNSWEFSYRHQSVDHTFLQGGHLNDFSIGNQIRLNGSMGLSSFIQYEHWAFPALQPLPQSDVVASFQITFRPGWHVRRGAGRNQAGANP